MPSCAWQISLQLLVKLAGRAGDENPAGDVAFAVLHALHDAGRLAALGTVGALGCVHHFFAIRGLCNLGHYLSPDAVSWRKPSAGRRLFVFVIRNSESEYRLVTRQRQNALAEFVIHIRRR